MTSLEESDISKALALAQRVGYLKKVRHTDKYGKWQGWKYVVGYPVGAPHPIELIHVGNVEHYKTKTWEEAEDLVNEKLNN